jgi:hypothetical protein
MDAKLKQLICKLVRLSADFAAISTLLSNIDSENGWDLVFKQQLSFARTAKVDLMIQAWDDLCGYFKYNLSYTYNQGSLPFESFSKDVSNEYDLQGASMLNLFPDGFLEELDVDNDDDCEDIQFYINTDKMEMSVVFSDIWDRQNGTVRYNAEGIPITPRQYGDILVITNKYPNWSEKAATEQLQGGSGRV